MIQILDRLSLHKQSKKILGKACKGNGIKVNIVTDISISKLKLFHEKFTKIYEQSNCKKTYFWGENELKTFHWVLIIISALQNILILNFDDKQWQIMTQIFRNKTLIFLKYEAERFLKQKRLKNKNWTEQEDNLLMKVVVQYEKNRIILEGKQIQKLKNTYEKNEISESSIPRQPFYIKNEQKEDSEQQMDMKSGQIISEDIQEKSMKDEGIKTYQAIQHLNIQNQFDEDKSQASNREKIHWNFVARKIYQASNQQFFRCAKHCRERWLNHVDPSKERGKWTQQQDKQLIQQIKRLGMRWSEVAAKLNRTEHSVKNRYNSLINNNVKKARQNKHQAHKETLQFQNGPTINIYADNQGKKMSSQEGQQLQINRSDQSDISGISQLKHLTLINDDLGNTVNNSTSFSPFLSHSPRITGIITPLINEPSPLNFSVFGSIGFASYHRMFDQKLKNQENSMDN